MAYNIARSLSEVAQRQGQKIGLIEARSGREFSFDLLESLSNTYASYLSQNGVNPRDRVMLMVKPSADFICLSFALFKIGATVILIDPGMGYKNLLRCVADVEPKILIGIPKALLFTKIFRRSFRTINKSFCCGNSFGLFGQNLFSVNQSTDHFEPYSPGEDDLAAIIFTTGSTGPPKGVRYEHSIFAAQLERIKSYYKIGPEDVDQPAFPLFALFSTALGACAVIPDMDPTRPAQVDPNKFITSLEKYNVTYSFGSPALWNTVTNYCETEGKALPSLRKILMAGAPVSGELIERMKKLLPTSTEIHTPYGATESLPIVSIEGSEVVNDTWSFTQKGRGTCVGRPLPGIDVRIISLHDNAIPLLEEKMFIPVGEVGEIIVSGDVVTRAYDNKPEETSLAKTMYENRLYHRMGDVGYLDKDGRVWFCGRKGHRVETKNGTKFTIPCEAIINNHPDVFRSALVGVTNGGDKVPVIVVELKEDGQRDKRDILPEIKEIAQASDLTSDIQHFLFHPNFPVDIRHNAKIFREKLSLWAADEVMKA